MAILKLFIHCFCANFRWDAAKAQFCTATVGMMGAVAALWLQEDPAQSHDGDGLMLTDALSTNIILAFSAGGFMHIAMVSILPDLLKESNPREALIQLCLILSGTVVMGLMSFL